MTDPAPTPDPITTAAPLRLERLIDAPIDVVWRLWTDPERFAAWYGPAGATVSVVELDARPRGRRFVGMAVTTPDGPMQMWFTGEFREVLEPTRLVYTDAMCDQQGDVLAPERLGLPAGHDVETVVEIELTDLDGRTGLLLVHHGVPAGSPGAAGWNSALDTLAARAAA